MSWKDLSGRSAALWGQLLLPVALFFFLAHANRSNAQEQRIPLADFHFHPSPEISPQQALRTMDAAGVRWAGNGVAGGNEDNVWALFLEAAPDRFIPFAGQRHIRNFIDNQGDAAWTLRSPEMNDYLQKLEQKLRNGQFRGIGELFANHTRRWLQHYPADSPLMQRLLNLAATYQAPLSIHLEAAPESVQELERLLPMDRKATVIWAHCGFWATASLVRKMMAQHENLFCELSIRDDRRLPRGHPRVSITGFGRHLHSDWKALLEDYSDRFLIGTDSRPFNEYGSIIEFFRTVLAQLNPEVAKRIAHENGQRLFRLGSHPKN